MSALTLRPCAILSTYSMPAIGGKGKGKGKGKGQEESLRATEESGVHDESLLKIAETAMRWIVCCKLLLCVSSLLPADA